MDFSFAQPLWFLLLPLWAVLVWWRRHPGPALSYPNLEVPSLAHGPSRRTGRWLGVLRAAGLGLLVIALARPQTHEGLEEIRASGVDIMLAVDLSDSMKALDFADRDNIVTRLDVGKEVLREFVEQRPHDRLGLIAFAEDAYLLSPLTLNHTWLHQNIDRLRLRFIPGEQTGIGPAIAMGTNKLRKLEDAQSRILILLTDGENNRQDLPPLAAAEAAAFHDVRIYTIAIGKEGWVIVPSNVDAEGQVYVGAGRQTYNEFDTSELEKISEITGGRSYRATDLRELRDIYAEIDRLERTEAQIDAITISDEWFALPAGIGSAFFFAGFILQRTRWQRLP
ncbi:MAG: VWA domain-containing protein [Opitutales bacterium]